MTAVITSASNPLVKQVRALRSKKARAETQTFIVEGIHHVGEALEAGWQVDIILHAPDLLTSPYAREVLARAEGLRLKVQQVSAVVIESIADKENPQGMIAVVRARINTLESSGKISRAAALVSPQDPGNVGTILRTLDAVGADALFVLDGGVELYHPTIVRASMGALFWKPVINASFNDFVAWSRGHRMQLIGSSAHATMDYRSVSPQTGWILVLGSEQKGLSQDQLAQLDATVALPMRGREGSLNMAVAAGILLYQLSGL